MKCICGNEFTVKNYRNTAKNRYCSRACSRKYAIVQVSTDYRNSILEAGGKTCGRCKEFKSLELYNRKGSWYSSICKYCNSLNLKKHHQENPDSYRAKTKKKRGDMKAVVELIRSENPCCVCKESSSACIDFHHIDDKLKDDKLKRTRKSFSESFSSYNKLFNEIEKCAALCANCHRKMHAGEIRVPIIPIDVSGLRSKLSYGRLVL